MALQAGGAVDAEFDERAGAEMLPDAGSVNREMMLEPAQRGSGGDIEIDGCGDVALICIGIRLLAHRQEVEDAAAAVVDTEDRELRTCPTCADEAADVVQQGELADHEVDGRFRRD